MHLVQKFWQLCSGDYHTFFSVFYIWIVQCTVYGVWCTVCIVQHTAYSVQHTVYSVQCTVYGVGPPDSVHAATSATLSSAAGDPATDFSPALVQPPLPPETEQCTRMCMRSKGSRDVGGVPMHVRVCLHLATLHWRTTRALPLPPRWPLVRTESADTGREVGQNALCGPSV